VPDAHRTVLRRRCRTAETFLIAGYVASDQLAPARRQQVNGHSAAKVTGGIADETVIYPARKAPDVAPASRLHRCCGSAARQLAVVAAAYRRE
jgi:hypothetical protein